jgi:hypothetical protein
MVVIEEYFGVMTPNEIPPSAPFNRLLLEPRFAQTSTSGASRWSIGRGHGGARPAHFTLDAHG